MPKTHRIRERVSAIPSAEAVQQRASQGWRLVAVEWERDVPNDQPDQQEPPFGMRIASDCAHLEDDPVEREVLMTAIQNIVHDRPPTEVADDLNRLGYRTRHGAPWTAVSVFKLLPRMIEAGPRIFSTDEWADRKRRTLRALGGE
jgi:hypothetical protein